MLIMEEFVCFVFGFFILVGLAERGRRLSFCWRERCGWCGRGGVWRCVYVRLLGLSAIF